MAGRKRVVPVKLSEVNKASAAAARKPAVRKAKAPIPGPAVPASRIPDPRFKELDDKLFARFALIIDQAPPTSGGLLELVQIRSQLSYVF